MNIALNSRKGTIQQKRDANKLRAPNFNNHNALIRSSN